MQISSIGTLLLENKNELISRKSCMYSAVLPDQSHHHVR